jgi:hypothetical protein
MQALKDYLEQLQAVAQQSHATNELSYHGALEHLLRTLRPNMTLVHEPTRTVVGRPDFAILHQHAPVGYVEAEAYAADLDSLPPARPRPNRRLPPAPGELPAVSILTRPWERVQHAARIIPDAIPLLFQSSPARGGGCNYLYAWQRCLLVRIFWAIRHCELRVQLAAVRVPCHKCTPLGYARVD